MYDTVDRCINPSRRRTLKTQALFKNRWDPIIACMGRNDNNELLVNSLGLFSYRYLSMGENILCLTKFKFIVFMI